MYIIVYIFMVINNKYHTTLYFYLFLVVNKYKRGLLALYHPEDF